MAKHKYDMIVKSNKLINASYYLTLSEIRLLDLALSELSDYEECEKHITTLPEFVEVRAEQYAEVYGVSMDTAYSALQEASEQLFGRYFTYQVRSEKYPSHFEERKARWVQEIGYINGKGAVTLSFTKSLVELAGRLKGSFSRYHLCQKAPLTSIYAHRLYEMMMQWRLSAKEVPYVTYWDLRNRFEIKEDEYERVANFKARVLDPAVKQINDLTDINVSYEQAKEGRTIVGFVFKFKFKKGKKTINDIAGKAKIAPEGETSTDNGQQPKPKPIVIPAMTDKQRNTFANKLANNFDFIRDYSASTTGKQRHEVISWIDEQLADDTARQKMAKHLLLCGYEPPNRMKK